MTTNKKTKLEYSKYASNIISVDDFNTYDGKPQTNKIVEAYEWTDNLHKGKRYVSYDN